MLHNYYNAKKVIDLCLNKSQYEMNLSIPILQEQKGVIKEIDKAPLHHRGVYVAVNVMDKLLFFVYL